jgi:hypothetical protein
VRITVFRLNATRSTGRAARKAARRTRIATVFRSTSTAKRYTFRLTEKSLRNLKAGRYQVEVRVGTSRANLGPATTRTITVAKAKAARRR